MKAKKGKGGAAMEIACSWLTWLVKKTCLTPPWRSTFCQVKSPTFTALNPFAFYRNKARHLGYRPEFLGPRAQSFGALGILIALYARPSTGVKPVHGYG